MLRSLFFLAVAATSLTQDLATLKSTLARSDSVTERVETLERIAALYSADEAGLPVTAAVVSALDDDSLQVRARAAELLGGLDADTAITGLARAASRFGRDREAVVGAWEDLPDLPVIGKMKKDQYLKKLEAFNAAVEAYTVRLREWIAYRGVLVAAIAGLSDERGIGALGDILAVQPTGEDADVVIDALLAFGTTPAFDHVLGAVEAFEDTLRKREKHRKGLARQRSGKKPRNWAGTAAAWKEREAQRIAGIVAKYDESTATVDEWGRGLRERLRAFAAAKGLAEPPAELVPYRQWGSWAKSARVKLGT